MGKMRFRRLIAMALGFGVLLAADAPSPIAYSNDFEKAEIGKVPDEFMVLDGPFAVRQVDGNKCLELAGDPIGAFGALFGPAGITGSEVSARIWAAPTGKRFPEFGIGANDAGGYKLMLLPGQHKLELRKGDAAAGTSNFEWSPSSWTCFKLRIAQVNQSWIVQGKAWKQGQAEPTEWPLTVHDPEAPSPGRASIWGNDYSERPIRFDDLRVSPLK
jgi:hypothetical protein